MALVSPHVSRIHGIRSTLMAAARLVLCSYLAAACTVPLYQSTSTLPAAGTAPIPHAIVHLTGGTIVYPMSDVLVVADSIVGFDEPSGARRTIPEASVALVETRIASPWRTVGLIAAIVAGTALVAAAALAYAISHSTWD